MKIISSDLFYKKPRVLGALTCILKGNTKVHYGAFVRGIFLPVATVGHAQCGGEGTCYYLNNYSFIFFFISGFPFLYPIS